MLGKKGRRIVSMEETRRNAKRISELESMYEAMFEGCDTTFLDIEGIFKLLWLLEDMSLLTPYPRRYEYDYDSVTIAGGR